MTVTIHHTGIRSNLLAEVDVGGHNANMSGTFASFHKSLSLRGTSGPNIIGGRNIGEMEIDGGFSSPLDVHGVAIFVLSADRREVCSLTLHRNEGI